MTTPAEARATKATQAQRQAAIKAVSELPASGGGYMALYHETLSDKIGEGSITKIVDTALNAALALPPPEAKDGAAPSPETAVREPSIKEQSNFDDDTQRDFLNREAFVPETGWRLVPVVLPQDARLAVARAIGHSAGETNQMVRADIVWTALLAAAPVAPSSDLAALEAVAQRLEGSANGLSLASFARQDAALVRIAILHLKAQPNAGPSADGGKGA